MEAIIRVILWITYFVSLYFAVFWFLVLIDSTDKKSKKLSLTRFPMVSIAVPAYNEEECIVQTLHSLNNLDYPKDKLEIIVVNDGSKDRTESLTREYFRENNVTHMRLVNQSNGGKGTALNNALFNCKGEFFVCQDADSFVKPDALQHLLPHFVDDKVAAVLPLLKVKQPKSMLQKFQWYEYTINLFYKGLMGILDCIHVAPGPFSVYKKEILWRLGGFDADNNLTEDLEIVLRLQKNHYKIIQVFTTEVETLAPDSIKELYKQRNRWYKGSILNVIKHRSMFLNKNYGDFGMIQMPTIVVFGLIAMIIILTSTYYGFKPYVKYLYHLSYVNFDVMTFLRNLSPNFSFLDVDYTSVAIITITLSMTIYMLVKSHEAVGERLLKYGIISLLAYIFIYFFVLSIMWVGITIDLLIGKRQKW